MKFSSKTFILLAGPLLFLLLWLLEAPEGMNESAWAVLAVTLWMALWWVTEAVPIAVTALLPILLFPLTGALDIGSTTSAYGDKYVFLYLGGFLIAIAIEKWNLHKRIALSIINLIGTDVKFIILGFMVATAFLSMWISNTATSVMMLPIGTAIISQLQDDPATAKNENAFFGKALMLAIAYSASIGGIATLIGTPPNLVLAGVVQKLYGIEISFLQWAKLGIPVSIVLLLICWKYLTRFAFDLSSLKFPAGKAEIASLLAGLGKMSFQEKVVLTVFSLTAFAWITRSFLLQPIVPFIDDTIIAIAAGSILFALPAGNGERVLHWEDTVRVPWGIIILFGGGMALAKAFGETGLAVWLGEQLTALEDLPLYLLVLVVVAAVNFLTEVTSNLATTAMLLPILAPMALAMGVHPYFLLVAATLAASCAFMLPVATPPNAVVFGSGHLTIPDMARAGIWMNTFSILLISLIIYFLLPWLWNFKIEEIPAVFG
ncbi:solute carrier family 13 (sodium-dependent dicarboxylate transporter), member 2/3/5 [Salinimicrobium catena]|uniref:Solute carrier family 13 (Sodium-dependent dicarboxylate transporter), member 2/3/5 n=1 Tax=Salinimicrobium catena TaxID=390640 RepID=A0A1H5MYZ1_9FLAO|nr:SLC13 family permease [Salinimicrobium catena]SDL31194.1 solute carrier family 13 (sodium-dependent dicarboxylate transporter), member 2/3/5 [Salinimicrobium catena]SEE93618.1 solute carrier family 13 (sodium-dependent dicarboxylate transporter), member 2/3/5 [Salinimicrobium catena]